MPKGRPRRYCKCGCGERLDLLPNYTKQRRYINVAHRQQVARLRKWTAPIRDHQIVITVNFQTRAGKLVGITTAVSEPAPLMSNPQSVPVAARKRRSISLSPRCR